MEPINDDVLGALSYQYGWVRDYDVVSFGEPIRVRLVVPCAKDSNIEDAQREAFAAFDKQRNVFIKAAERALYKYYEDISPEYRERFGDFADEMAPIISSVEQLKSLVQLEGVVAQRSFVPGDRVVGLLYSCSWETDLGAAVKFVNEVIQEVGPQDIVL